jgi:hypothetical protein
VARWPRSLGFPAGLSGKWPEPYVPPVYVPERPPVVIPIDAGDNMFIQDAEQPTFDNPVFVKKSAKTVYLNAYVQPSLFGSYYNRDDAINVMKQVRNKKGKLAWVVVESIDIANGTEVHQLSIPRKKGKYKVVAMGAEFRGDNILQYLKITKKKKNVVFLDEYGDNIPKKKVKKSKKKKK